MGTRAWLAVLSATGTLWLSCAPAWGAPIQVNTEQDAVQSSDGKCSLREAISAANHDAASGNVPGECAAGSAADTISVPSGTYSLTTRGVREDLNATGDLDVFSSMTIQGAAGAASTFIDGTATDTNSPGSPDRVFDVYNGSTVAINGVTIRNGRAPTQSDASPDGGGILISSDSTLSLDSDAITSNKAGASNSISSGMGGGVATGGAVTVKNSSFTDNRGGAGGSGGAISGVSVDATDTRFLGNKAGTPQACCGACPGADTGGSGGAIVSGSATVTRSTFVSNSAGDGGGCSGVGNGGSGGAISSAGGDLKITDSTFSSNAAGDRGGGSGSFPGSGSAVMAESASSFEVTGSTFSSNTIPGTGTAGDTILSSTGSVSVTNSTLTSNTGGGDVVAATIGGTAVLTNTTVASNAVPPVSGTVTLSATLLASNAGGNCTGATITDGGNNLSYPASDASCPAAFAHGDPKLASALADNGGPTQTLALGAGSAAADGVGHAFCPPPAQDQRGVPRPQGGLCDIGAFEFATPDVSIATPADGAHYPQGASVAASYACTEAGMASIVAACSGTVANGAAVDTSTAGAHTFAVTATDKAGSQTARSVGYTVDAPNPPGGGGGGTGTGVATVSGVHLSASTFRAAGSGPSAVAAKHVPTGAVVSFSLDKEATVKFTVERSAIGRRVKHRCVAPTTKNAKKPKCKRWVKAPGSFSRAGAIGLNRFRFTGRLRGKRLSPGGYRLVITPQTGVQAGKPVRIGFHIVR